MNWVTLKLSQGKGEEASVILQRGLQLNPKNEELRLLYASHLGDSGQFDRAIGEYETILQHNPRDLMAANNLAALLTDQKGDAKSLDRALSLSRDFEQRAPNPFFLDTLGWVHLKMGHQDDALRVIQRAVTEAPQHPLLNYHLGMAHFKAGHRSAAQTHLQKALNSKQPFPGMEEAKAVLAESDRIGGERVKIVGSFRLKGSFQPLCQLITALSAIVLMTGCVTPEPTSVQSSLTDPGYQLGPEDVLMVSVWKDEHLTREVVVRPDGMVSFPLVGDLPAAEHTVEDIRQDLAKRLARYIPNPHVSVAIMKLQSYKIYVMGRVNKPGEYLIGHYTDVLQALSLGGRAYAFCSGKRHQNHPQAQS